MTVEGAAEATGTRVRATLTSGDVLGDRADGIDRYLGVPYAGAPVGALRFAPPVSAPSWQGARDATTHGASAPQSPYVGGLESVLPSVRIDGDEFLNLIVWAPAEPSASGHPVLVWVHGGALSRGTARG